MLNSTTRRFPIAITILACGWATILTIPVAAQAPAGNAWSVGAPVLVPGPAESFDEVSVKDPSIVFADGAWHVFYTARFQDEYTTGYVSAPTLDDLQSAPRHKLPQIRGRTRYGCAPQVFYFEPQRRWYLIFQTRDANYQPMFSTTATLAEPESWGKPTPLIEKDAEAKWIDFWVICDASKAYLFYTQAHNGVMVRSTSLDAFPDGWGPSQKVFTDVQEAVHIYKVRGRREYHMFYERNSGGVRSFGKASAKNLTGPWTKVTDRYATGDQLQFSEGIAPWTDMVSHGEILRTGCDQNLEYDPNNCRWLIQGLLKRDANVRYELLPWKLGVMSLKRRKWSGACPT